MNQNRLSLYLPIFALTIILCGAGCNSEPPQAATDETSQSVDLGDGKTQDPDGFIRFPGEPSRTDKSYYIVEDLCGQFTSEFIAGLLGRPVIKTEPSPYPGLYSCSYYLSENEYVMINLNYLDLERQKHGHEILGRTVKTDTSIPMNHAVVYQEDGLINEIYFGLWPGKYLSLARSGHALNEQEYLDFAIKLGNKIKDCK
ncbi:hypothetical protein KJ611_01400 [Patescibacteria group bacterium]|nr:hypothetical protein [Patescibacteria group bacterium]MBU1705172.1 hypothetical protein [Patescibacteria group bacterium]